MKQILWYKLPAEGWLEGLPIGNGRLAAMVYGDQAQDRLTLNHEWLWRGVQKDRDNEPVAEHLEEVRALLKQEDFYQATALANKYFGGKGGVSGVRGRVDAYQPAGDVLFTLQDMKQYIRRQLDIQTGIVQVERETAGGNVVSEFMANPEYNLIFGKWHALSGKFSGKLGFTRPMDEKAVEMCELKADQITFTCQFEQGINYQVNVHIKTDGKVNVQEEIIIEDATEVTIAVNIGTSVKGIEQELSQYPVPNQTWEQLIESNKKAFTQVLNRLVLDVDVEEINLPTDERIEEVKRGKEDPELILLYFNYGRYLLAASSIRGELPANLQGKWNDSITPPWESDYHFDINLEMNYWMVEAGNMSECQEALLKYIERYVPHAKKAAKDLYGCRGIYLPIQSDAWGRATPEAQGWAVWIGAAPWIAQHFWWHYIYSGDQSFLEKRAYPIFKEIAQFYEDYLVKDEQGTYQIMPSQSPENRFEGTGEWPVSLGISAAMDVQLAYDALGYAITSANTLDIDQEEVAKWQAIQDHLPPFAIGKDGRLLEWECERKEVEPGHRHVSHLYGLFPSNLFNPIERPKQYEAAIQSLNYRLAQGGGHTGWSRSWIACLSARIGDAEHLWEHMNGLIRDFATSSLLDLHPPRIFQIDGNLGAVAAVLEGIAQTWGGKVHLLRALPGAWQTGKVSGIKVPGGHELEMQWQEGKLQTLQVTMGYGEKLVLAGLANQLSIPEGAERIGDDIVLKAEYPMITLTAIKSDFTEG